MFSSLEEYTEWYAVFSQTKANHLVFRFLDKDINHCYAIKDLNDYQWLVIQPRLNMVEAKILIKKQYPHIRMITGPDAKIVKVKVYGKLINRGTICWFNCVEQVKALLGIKSVLTLTPRQLYKGLIGDRYGSRSN